VYRVEFNMGVVEGVMRAAVYKTKETGSGLSYDLLPHACSCPLFSVYNLNTPILHLNQ
jgi:hypothetical protein